MAEKSALELRDALRLLAPGAVTLVSTMYRDQPNVMTAGWLLSLSLEPTYLGVAVQPGRLSHEFITKTEQFALNFPNIDLIAAVHLCGMKSGRDEDKFETANLTPEDATTIEAPLVAECVGHIECSVVDRITLGDHDLFVGRVLAVSAVEEAFDQIWQVETDAGQLLHHLGGDRYAGMSRPYRASSEPDQD
jgi:flavin reductase (DIM6/NTAB) family NADH-FMN oxidoreductase RutF